MDAATEPIKLSGLAVSLQRLREAKGWSRETLAHHAGLSFAAIAQLETCRRQDPRLSTLVALARALEVSLDELVRGYLG